jgi:hypothetical protein
MSSVFLTAQWKNLIIANFEVDPNVLASRIPFGTELDLFEGKAIVSLVGFMFLDTLVYGIPFPLHRNFEEVNVPFFWKKSLFLCI